MDDKVTTSESTPGSTPQATAGSTPGSAPAASTTTTTQPLRPTEADTTALVGAQQMELEVGELFHALVAGGKLDEAHLAPVAVLRDAHRAHAQAISALVGKASASTPGTMLASAGTLDPTNAKAVQDAANTIYDKLISAYTEMIGAAQSVDALNVLTSIGMSLGKAKTMLAAAFATPSVAPAAPATSDSTPTSTTEAKK